MWIAIVAYFLGLLVGIYWMQQRDPARKKPIIIEVDSQYRVEQTISVTYKTNRITATVNPN